MLRSYNIHPLTCHAKGFRIFSYEFKQLFHELRELYYFRTSDIIDDDEIGGVSNKGGNCGSTSFASRSVNQMKFDNISFSCSDCDIFLYFVHNYLRENPKI